MSEPAGVETTQTVVRTLIIRDVVLDLDAQIPCDLVDDDARETRCSNPAHWSLLFDLVGRWNACDSCKDECIAEAGANLGDGSSVRLLEVRAL